MKQPRLYNSFQEIKNAIDDIHSMGQTQTLINGKWVKARPEGYYNLWDRFYYAWLVFTGKCDLFKWPEGR